ncbi:MAG TPA: NAD-dependent epimerase/dehydratase family protein [Bdellovibrionota bacterium]|nr:NAD-dependent epimerase/dehydratase family protein [Bdellovibrionota bacterium]
MKAKNNIKSILIIGIAGGLAHMTSQTLQKKYPQAKIFGVDSRDVKSSKKTKGIHYRKVRYTRNEFEKLFRNNKFDVVFHLGRLSHAALNTSISFTERLDFSLVGTKTIFDLSLSSGVSKIIFLSTFHVYGASADNPAFIDEESPLKASINFPDLRDVVEMDFTATNWMWKNQNNIDMVVLRPCNIIGSHINNAMTKYLMYKYSPYPLDYNPAFQFIHEEDMAHILERSLHELPTGVYNIAPQDTILIRDALKTCGNKGLPLPLSLISPLAKFLKKLGSPFPEYLFEYLKYPCIIDNTLIQKHLGANYLKYDLNKTLKSLVGK